MRIDVGLRAWAAASVLVAAAVAAPVLAQSKKDTAVIGMTLEPPGLDPTAGAASAIGEVVLYNVLETLTKIEPDGSTAPLLAQSWSVTPDNKTWAFRLRQGVKFQNGEPFDASTVKFSFERAVAPGSVNKDKAVFANILNIATTDAHSVILTLKNPNPDFLFQLYGQAASLGREMPAAALFEFIVEDTQDALDRLRLT